MADCLDGNSRRRERHRSVQAADAYGLGLDVDRLSHPDTEISGHILIMKVEWNFPAIAGSQ